MRHVISVHRLISDADKGTIKLKTHILQHNNVSNLNNVMLHTMQQSYTVLYIVHNSDLGTAFEWP